jgi:hypothetical protein
MRTIASSIFLLLTTIYSIAQKNDSDIYKAAAHLLKNNIRSIDTTLCDAFIKVARDKISVDSLYFQISSEYNFSKTAKMLMINDYKLFEEDIIHGDFIPIEIVCYHKLMEDAIFKKWGKDFFKKIDLSADSLDAIGKGYFEASLKSESISEFLKKNFQTWDVIKNGSMKIMVSFDINEKGLIDNTKFYSGKSIHMPFNEITQDSMKKDLELIFKKMEWYPAKFKGHEIKQHKIIIVDQQSLQ